MLFWLVGVAMYCEDAVGNMTGTLVGGSSYCIGFGMSGGIVGTVGMAGIPKVGIVKKPSKGGYNLNGCGGTC